MERCFTADQVRDLKVLVAFVRFYCHAHHRQNGQQEVPLPEELRKRFSGTVHLCPECAALVGHGIQKRGKCPLDPKPSCKKCHIHCYSKEYRAEIRKIMAYSGKRMILRGRLDYLWHYLF